jgi:serine/threonine protein kinase
MVLPPLETGFRLGKYEILAHIATGGMGAVYKARDIELGRLVALKVLDPDLASRDAVRERFRREACHAARLSHRHIVTVYESREEQGFHFIAMEFIHGIDLEKYIDKKGRLNPEEARLILLQATKALGHAHLRGIVHRDIKPGNFLLAKQGGKMVVKLADLGLAIVPNEADFRVTRAGFTVGTIDYMAPEQASDSSSADIRSDIYSLGCTAYHMLAGQPPFAGGGLGERVFKHMEEAPPDLRQLRPEVPVGLWKIIQRMLAKKQADRYQTPRDLLDALKRSATQTVQEVPTLGITWVLEPGSSVEIAKGAFGEPVQPTDSNPTPAPSRRPASARREAGATNTPTPVPKDVSPSGGASLEQAAAAAKQFERASEVIASSGERDYARELLFSCCKLNPGNTTYRKELRRFLQEEQPGLLRRWFSSLSTLTRTAKVKAAKRSGEHRKVLELGEQVLAQSPADVSTHLAMAEAAEELGLLPLAIWLAEQGREQAPDNTDLMRALAQLYEKEKQLSRAIALWELVRKADPTDVEAPRKINALSVSEHIVRARYDR